MTTNSIAEQLKQTRSALAAISDSAALDAELLICHVTGRSRAGLLAHQEQQLDSAQQHQLDTLKQRRLSGEPMAYILQRKEFWGLDFYVDPSVLIPRPDTEILVETAVQILADNDTAKRILDLGTGSGAIAIALAKDFPQHQVSACEQSKEALAIAQANANQHGYQINFIHSDWFSDLPVQKFDLIVSNPPYIASSDPHLQAPELQYEPLAALHSGADGLDDIRQIIAASKAYLSDGGWLCLEHGYDQALRVAELFKAHAYHNMQQRQDLGGNDRVTYAQCLSE